MASKRKPEKATPDTKRIEERLQRYGEGTGRDKFGKKTNQLEAQTARAVPLAEVGAEMKP